ncbi:hypothetical protein [Planctomycetes bacterium TBK1r]|uniref:SGNH hydrolase-type esterase domain-containing protein n=1 Tax=Stieleria magnilauensis TaxID=2527963 RepID=A0ABX5XNP5_9BACT|nr:hypothetical protein TBK1r_19330 [Planctomycetes bacterium TBK1r]
MSTPEELPDPIARQVVGAFERRLVGVALVTLPLITGIGFVIAGRYSHVLLFLQSPADWSTLWSRPIAYAGGALAACAIVAWWISTKLSTERYRRVNGLRMVLAVLCMVWLLDAIVDHPRVRFALEESVKARAPQLDFVRNIAFKQQSLREGRTATIEGQPRIVILGSSQINLGIDTAKLQQTTAADDVLEVCMPGMVPLQYLALADRVVGQTPTHVVCWLSEFDFFRESTLPTIRLRWSMDRNNFGDVASTLSTQQQFSQRAELADLAIAGMSTLWQQRSLIQKVGFRFWWAWDAEGVSVTADEVAVGAELVDQQQGLQNVRRNIQRTSLVNANFSAFEQFARQMIRHDVRLIVIEGESHPETMDAYPPEFRTETRERLARMANSIGFEYLSENDRPAFDTDQWRDAVHLNQSGRDRLTAFVCDLILLSPPSDWSTRHPN